MRGQWLGSYVSSSGNGTLMINRSDRGQTTISSNDGGFEPVLVVCPLLLAGVFQQNCSRKQR